MFLIVGLFPIIGNAEISKGGKPFSFTAGLNNTQRFEILPSLDVKKALDEDALDDGKVARPWRFGINLEVDFNLLERGETKILPEEINWFA